MNGHERSDPGDDIDRAAARAGAARTGGPLRGRRVRGAVLRLTARRRGARRCRRLRGAGPTTQRWRSPSTTSSAITGSSTATRSRSPSLVGMRRIRRAATAERRIGSSPRSGAVCRGRSRRATPSAVRARWATAPRCGSRRSARTSPTISTRSSSTPAHRQSPPTRIRMGRPGRLRWRSRRPSPRRGKRAR